MYCIGTDQQTGGKLLLGRASSVCFTYRIGDRDTYRIGGDEFVAFVKDGRTERIGGMITDINAEMETHGYHVSIGVCSCEKPIDIDSVIKSAEAHMSDEKKRYYDQKGAGMRSR